MDICFYCDESITDEKMHHISFFHNEEDRNEILCRECYNEWLQGIKE
ncbi:hypothetical protein [Aquibacillus kalidii]|nr:hypothetical protein [Aquibacillus kalidii]